MGIFLTVIHVVACLTLILVILLQAGRGQGLASASFGSGNVQSLFGTRAGDFLTKATTAAAICFLLTCIGLDVLETHKSRSLLRTTRERSPIDIDQIKKALEKVKAEVPLAPAKPENVAKSNGHVAAGKPVDAFKPAAAQPAPAAASKAAPETAATAPKVAAKS